MKNLGYKTTLRFYRMKFKSKLARFNHKAELPDYFGPMIGDKKEVAIAELATGPICAIGNLWKDVKVNLYASDILKNEYDALWKEYNVTPVIPIEYQDMENLTYSDNFFDIVHCVNALDHTLDAKKALKEMIRVCKPGGWIYLRHSPDQMKKYRGMHAWDINMINGEIVFSNPKEKFLLSEFGDFKIPDRSGFERKGLIVSILNKPVK
jgi:ubiquinone/menaquinone biosynthesis C-methylase UbiE